MSHAQVPEPRRGEQPNRPSALDSAYSRVAAAYRLARRAVFDLHPHGLPDAAELSDAQRVLLSDLQDAEANLDAQRRLQWERRPDVDVAGHPVP